jgi:hypothetical protein
MDSLAQFSLYQPSGRVRWLELVAYTVAAAIVSALLGWLYARALLFELPFLFAPIFTCVFGIVVVIFLSLFISKTHSRWVLLNTVWGVLGASLFIWVRWATTVHSMGITDALTFAQSGPIGWLATLWRIAQVQSELNPRAFSPVLQSLVWLLEWALVAGMAYLMTVADARKPYSETAQAWAVSQATGELFWHGGTSNNLKNHLAQNGAQALLDFLPATSVVVSVATDWWTVKVEGLRVEADPLACWLNVWILLQTRNEKGGVTTRKEPVVESWWVDEQVYTAVMAHLQNPQAVEQADASERPTPVELQPALAAFKAENFNGAITLAKAHCQHPEVLVQADAHRLCALSSSELAQWDSAFEHFHALFALEATTHNALQLATTSVMAGELLRGQAWFEKAEQINAGSEDMPTAGLRTAFMSALENKGEMTALMPHIEWLGNAYRSVCVTDSHFLFMRGLPFFSVFLERSLPVLQANLAAPEVKKWYAQMSESVDDEGQVMINAHIQAIQAG